MRWMPLLFLRDRRLYHDSAHFFRRFAWRAPGGSGALLYHCYWAGTLGEHHELCLKSLLVTQSPPFEVWVWMPPEDLARNRDFVDSLSCAPAVRWKAYCPQEEAAGSWFAGHVGLLEDDRPKLPARRPAAISDGLRLLVLARYGGIYFDLDTLFLRDLRPLCGVDFIYQWSNQPFGSNALSHFRPGSPALSALVERSLQLGSCHPAALLRFRELASAPGELMVFPSFLFDPVWIAHDTAVAVNDYCNQFDDFFAHQVPMTMGGFFPGAYAYDWHNRWDTPIRPGTIAGQLRDEVRASFASRQSRGA